MPHKYLAHVVDAVVTPMDSKGRFHMRQNLDLCFTAVGIRSLIGDIVGVFFHHPSAGAAIGGATAGLAGRFQDYGTGDDLMREAAGELEGGWTALFMLARTGASDQVIERLRRSRWQCVAHQSES